MGFIEKITGAFKKPLPDSGETWVIKTTFNNFELPSDTVIVINATEKEVEYQYKELVGTPVESSIENFKVPLTTFTTAYKKLK